MQCLTFQTILTGHTHENTPLYNKFHFGLRIQFIYCNSSITNICNLWLKENLLSKIEGTFGPFTHKNLHIKRFKTNMIYKKDILNIDGLTYHIINRGKKKKNWILSMKDHKIRILFHTIWYISPNYTFNCPKYLTNTVFHYCPW